MNFNLIHMNYVYNILKDNEIIKVLHNAFDAYELPVEFAAGKTIHGIDGKDYNQEAFCKVLIAVIHDKHYDMDWPFAARLVK